MRILTRVGNAEVSTVLLPALFQSTSCPYETAIFYDDGTSEVQERYKTEGEAKEGHKKYVELLKEKVK
jgi:hypothetical protein